MDKLKLSAAIVAELGGPAAVARIVHLQRGSINYWLTDGIPDNRLDQLRGLFPKIIKPLEAEFSTAAS